MDEQIEPEVKIQLDKIEDMVSGGSDPAFMKQLARDAIRLATRSGSVKGEAKQDIILAMSMLNQAGILAQSPQTIGEARKLQAIARRLVR